MFAVAGFNVCLSKSATRALRDMSSFGCLLSHSDDVLVTPRSAVTFSNDCTINLVGLARCADTKKIAELLVRLSASDCGSAYF